MQVSFVCQTWVRAEGFNRNPPPRSTRGLTGSRRNPDPVRSLELRVPENRHTRTLELQSHGRTAVQLLLDLAANGQDDGNRHVDGPTWDGRGCSDVNQWTRENITFALKMRKPGVGKQSGHLCNPADVLLAVDGGEAQVLVQALANVVSVQRVAGNSVGHEKLLQGKTDGRLSGTRQT
ncbi:hypothetical protein EYF80_007939 [Liparis tanakae]|uniref:Uncharacterized protein n=1 Tax=Liparis tanakae TaxID=230148 RepID=A0A4Z2IV07_9TELE|nr:hypothetical protein EYF80_007939 [Liparis tanakae]